MEKRDNVILELKNVSKSFPGVKALNSVFFSVREGEIHGLVGENGAGKSTLIKIIMGVYKKDSGEMRYVNADNKNINISGPIDAKMNCISAAYQDLVVADKLTIGENLFLGNLPKTRFGFIDFKKVYEVSSKLLKEFDIDADPWIEVNKLSAGQQAMLAIAKMAKENVRLAIFDEPTALLTNEEVEILFKHIRKLKSMGVGIIYISHRLEEIIELCDKATILKDGQFVAELPREEINEDKLVTLMVGREISDLYKINRGNMGEKILELKNVNGGYIKNINFSLHKGEVLGFFGLMGSGRTEVVRSIFGADRIDSGEIYLKGKKIKIKNPYEAYKLGIGLVPEERRTQGLALPLSVKININAGNYRKVCKLGFIDIVKENDISERYKLSLNIKTPTVDKIVRDLSGGNQQKVVISKILNNDTDIIIFDEPTVGVDVGAKREIYRIIENLIKEGKSIIIISSYMPEIIGLADRIIVMSEGKITGEVLYDEVCEEGLLKLASL
jgi:ribose transport system ATP-binding protein